MCKVTYIFNQIKINCQNQAITAHILTLWRMKAPSHIDSRLTDSASRVFPKTFPRYFSGRSDLYLKQQWKEYGMIYRYLHTGHLREGSARSVNDFI